MAAAPSFVNQSVRTATGSAATATIALPGSRVTNNLLICIFNVVATGKTIAVGGGWSIFDSVNTNTSACIAWRLVDGTEAAPVFTWTGNATSEGFITQFTANLTVGPIGAHSVNQGSTTTGNMGPVSQLVSTANSSYVFGAAMWNANAAGVQSGSTNYTPLAALFGGVSASGLYTQGAPLYTSGTTSDTIAAKVATGSGGWAFFECEILGNGPTTNEPQAKVTQVVQPVLYSYSNPTTVRVTQVVMMVLRTDNNSKEHSSLYVFGQPRKP